MAPTTMYIDAQADSVESGQASKKFDDDGRPKRTGNFLTASAHIVTAVIGSGVLSLSWAIAQLGWAAGPAVLMAFAFITFFTSTLLADSYRSPGPEHGRRNYTYMDVVRAHLGGVKVTLCGLAQYTNLVGITIGYTITASISMVAVGRSDCFHKHQIRDNTKCEINSFPFMIVFAIIQIILSQIQNFAKISWLSIVAAVMSFAYASIGVGLSIAKTIGGGEKTYLTGTIVGVDVTSSEKVWHSFQALGNIAFAYAYSTVLVEIQDTLKSQPPENKAMKKASAIGVTTTTSFYISCGCIGYLAFGNNAPGNFLTGFGFFEPFWLVDIANICIAIHLVGAYQVFAQPLFSFVEKRCNEKYPENKFINSEHALRIPLCGVCCFNMFRLVWRTLYVMITALIAMIFPFFNDFLGLIGALSFYPLTVYFPIEIHIAQAKIPKYSFRWIWLKVLSWSCLVVSLVAFAGSIQGLAHNVRKFQPFKTQN